MLLHEYAHHFLISSSHYAMPRWLSEGAAEFFAAATFNADGSIQVGRPAQHRAYELATAEEVTVEELVDYDLYLSRDRRGYDAFYGRSWLLYHYLTFEAERAGQLSDYWVRVTRGEESVDAAKEVFGDLDELEDELDAYLKRRRLFNIVLSPEKIEIGKVGLRELPKGEAKMMDVRIRSQRGVTRAEAIELLEDAREIAEDYPDDPGVLTALAEAEHDAGNDREAIAAADRAITIDPSRPNAYVQKGYALFRLASGAEDAEAAYDEAMKPFSALNAIENDHPLPLIYYYRSFAESGREPTETARHALERASELAPFDHALAMNTAMMLAEEEKFELASAVLSPVAANPHGGDLAKGARRLLELFSEAERGNPLRVLLEMETEYDGETGDEEAAAGED